MPSNSNWIKLYGVGILTGIGFTMSLFVGNLAFVDHLNEIDGPIFKITDDPRVTWFGKFLRKFSIDELPQFFNVLKGDMNVVGPRPYPISEVKSFTKTNYYRRHSMKPGITGLWQIKDRNNIKNFKDSIKFDLDYIDNWSFAFDLYIIFMTIPTILKGKGK